MKYQASETPPKFIVRFIDLGIFNPPDILEIRK